MVSMEPRSAATRRCFAVAPEHLNGPASVPTGRGMEHPWFVVVTVAASPFLVAVMVWVSVLVLHAASDRRRLARSVGLSTCRRRGSRVRATWWIAAVSGALVCLVGTMSVLAAVALGIGVAAGGALVAVLGAVEPPSGFDESFDRALRGFLDDAA